MDIRANVKARNSAKQTPSVLHLMACIHLHEQQWLKQVRFADFTFYNDIQISVILSNAARSPAIL